MAIAAQIRSMDLLVFARACEGLAHWRGIVVSFLSLLLGGAVLLLGTYVTGASFSAVAMMTRLVFFLLFVWIASAGVSAAGIMLLDRARNSPNRSLADAVIFGAICVIKCALIALIALVVALLFLALAAIVYFICRMPGVGPLLLFFSHPLLALVAGMLLFSTALFFSLVFPALWDGDTTMQAVAKTLAVLKERFIIVVLNFIVMVLVTAFILGVVAWVIVPGYLSMTGLAARIIGPSIMGDMNSPWFMDPALFLMTLTSSGSGHMQAILLDTIVMAMLGAAMALQVHLMGINIVYLNVSEGVDVAGAESMLKEHLDQAKAKANLARQRALEAAERARQAAYRAPVPLSPISVGCPKCAGPIAAADVFCGNCGNKLK